MPQFDFVNNLWESQIFWLVVIFSVFFFLIHTLIAPRIQKILDSREQKLSADMRRAEELKDELERMLAEKDTLLAKARNEASNIYSKEMERVQKDIAKKQDEAQSKIDEQIATAEKKIASDRRKALKDVEKIATDIAAQVVEKITGEPADAKAIAKAIKEV